MIQQSINHLIHTLGITYKATKTIGDTKLTEKEKTLKSKASIEKSKASIEKSKLQKLQAKQSIKQLKTEEIANKAIDSMLSAQNEKRAKFYMQDGSSFIAPINIIKKEDNTNGKQ